MKKNREINEELINEIKNQTDEVERQNFISHLLKKSRRDRVELLKKGIPGIKAQYEDFTREKSIQVSRFMTYEKVASGATDTPEYYLQLILSCIIALFGLYINSPAVIIGAMLVAPLMNPILGFSAGWLWGSGKITLEAVSTLLKGIGLVIGITTSLTFIIPGIEITTEMLSRGYPTIFDILVAISCGTIGSYAFVNHRITSAVPGAAIAVALLPPLCTVGIGLGEGEWALAGGAAILFTINLISILLASVIVFSIVKLHPANQEKENIRTRAVGQIILTSVILLIIAMPLGYLTWESMQENKQDKIMTTLIHRTIPEENIFDISIEPRKGKKTRIRVITLESQLSQSVLNQLRRDLSAQGTPVDLQVFNLERNY